MDESMVTIKRNKEKVSVSVDPDLKDWLRKQKEEGISESTTIGSALAFYRGAQYKELENRIKSLEKEIDLTIQEYENRIRDLEIKLRQEELAYKKVNDKLVKLLLHHRDTDKEIKEPKEVTINDEIPDKGRFVM